MHWRERDSKDKDKEDSRAGGAVEGPLNSTGIGNINCEFSRTDLLLFGVDDV